MNGFFRILSSLFVLAVSTLTQSAFALPHNQVYAGFNVGVGDQTQQYDNSSNFTGSHTSSSTTTLNYVTPFNNSVSAPGFVGGLMLGYAQSIKKKFDLDYEFSVRSTAGTTSETDQMQSPFTYGMTALQEYTAKTTVNFPYTFDFVIKPMVAFTKKLAGYAKLGPSYTNMNTVLNFTNNSSLINASFNVTSGGINTTLWGYVFGAGIEYTTTKHFTIFGEYDFHQYATTTIKGVTVTDNGTATGVPGVTVSNTINYLQKILPYMSSIEIGLHYYF